MAKRLDLSADILSVPVAQPQAARVAVVAPAPVAPSPKIQNVPLQIRIPKSDAKAIRRAAVEADKSISDFMLECFHACMQNGKEA